MVTLTGTFTRLDGTPATGKVRVTPSRSPIMDPDGKIVISGPQEFPLGVDGKLSVPIPASNDPDLGPPFTYWIDVNLTHANWKINKVWIPHGSATVDLSEIADYTPTPGVATRVVTIPADGTDGQVLVWDGVGFAWDFPPEGPQGPPGEVTTAQLTTALAGKVTGTGMTLRHDTTVGTRVLLDHPGGTTMLYGDTGWRIITDGLTNGWTAESIHIRRVGSNVYFRYKDLSSEGASTISAFSLLNTFAPTVSGTTVLLTRNQLATPSPMQVWAGNTIIPISDFSPAGSGGVASWETNRAWPTTLPGTPA